jgi:sugar lactone lactonase YvrE
MTHRFSTARSTVLPMARASVFFDGVFSEPRLQHPEAVAVGPDGWIWCGTENGEILRIEPGGSQIELVARAGGFTLGLAFDGDRALFFCDNKDKAVYRLDLGSRRVARFSLSASVFRTIRSSIAVEVVS